MNIVEQFLKESYPDNPDDVVLKNKFYPSGLTEKQIYDYYIRNKKNILKWLDNRNVAFFMRIDSKLILKRYHKDKKIVLNDDNFEELINGRINVILAEHLPQTRQYVIDIDPGSDMTRKDAIDAAKFLEENLLIKMYTYHHEIITSGDRGLHFIGTAPNKKDINRIRNLLIEILTFITKNSKIYVVNKKGRHSGTVNFDLTSFVKNGLHICKHSLTKEGLICTDYKKGLLKIK